MPAGRPAGTADGWSPGAPRHAPARPAQGLPVAAADAPRDFEVRVDTAFDEVIAACADPAATAAGSTTTSVAAYARLHELGLGALGRGVAGRRARRAGCTASRSAGCSRGSRCSTGCATPPRSRSSGWSTCSATSTPTSGCVDVQWATPHLATLGVVEIARADYLAGLPARWPLPAPSTGPGTGVDVGPGGPSAVQTPSVAGGGQHDGAGGDDQEAHGERHEAPARAVAHTTTAAATSSEQRARAQRGRQRRPRPGAAAQQADAQGQQDRQHDGRSISSTSDSRATRLLAAGSAQDADQAGEAQADRDERRRGQAVHPAARSRRAARAEGRGADRARGPEHGAGSSEAPAAAGRTAPGPAARTARRHRRAPAERPSPPRGPARDRPRSGRGVPMRRAGRRGRPSDPGEVAAARRSAAAPATPWPGARSGEGGPSDRAGGAADQWGEGTAGRDPYGHGAPRGATRSRPAPRRRQGAGHVAGVRARPQVGRAHEVGARRGDRPLTA